MRRNQEDGVARTVLLIGVLVVAACGKDGSSQTPVPPVQDQVPVPPDVSGYWKGDWGEMVLRNVDGQIRGAYRHDAGTVVGTFAGDLLRGWWCETPSRKPDNDAGDVELRFTRDDHGPLIDGRWRYGATGAWKDDWDLRRVEGAEPPELAARFSEPDAFCPHP
jgi:hypothetical protein